MNIHGINDSGWPRRHPRGNRRGDHPLEAGELLDTLISEAPTLWSGPGSSFPGRGRRDRRPAPGPAANKAVKEAKAEKVRALMADVEAHRQAR